MPPKKEDSMTAEEFCEKLQDLQHSRIARMRVASDALARAMALEHEELKLRIQFAKTAKGVE